MVGAGFREISWENSSNSPFSLKSCSDLSHLHVFSLVTLDFMMNSSSFGAGINRVINGSSSVRPEDFPPFGKNSSASPARSLGSGGAPAGASTGGSSSGTPGPMVPAGGSTGGSSSGTPGSRVPAGGSSPAAEASESRDAFGASDGVSSS